VRAGRTVETGSLADLRHLTRTSVTAELAAVPAALGDVAGVHDLLVQGSRVRMQVDTAALGPVLQELTRAGVRGLTARPPTLEELFLQHYTTPSTEPTEPTQATQATQATPARPR
jgi:ABC-2 type transport system ATP-binding protein